MRVAFLIAVLAGVSAEAHRGGIDHNGGHYDRKTGIYHCHRSGCVPKPNVPPGARR